MSGVRSYFGKDLLVNLIIFEGGVETMSELNLSFMKTTHQELCRLVS